MLETTTSAAAWMAMPQDALVFPNRPTNAEGECDIGRLVEAPPNS
jgi:hypothetical protein